MSGQSNFYHTILRNVKTSEELYKLRAVLDDIFNDYFVLGAKEIGLELESNLKKAFVRKFGSFFDNKKIEIGEEIDLKEELEGLQAGLDAVKVVKLEVAFLPTKKFVEDLIKWTRVSISENVVFDIVVSPEIIGGARVSYRGKYCDFSVGKKLDDLMKRDFFSRICEGGE